MVSDIPFPSPSAPLTLPPRRVQKWVLQNGLTVIVEEDRSAPVASVQAWCLTGSIHEDRFLGAGLSHILEHMLFKGTTTRTGQAIVTEIQDQGGYINAYTSFDRTVYWVDIPKAGVAIAIDVLADVMVNATLPEEEYAKEQEVIRREFAMGYDDPDRMISHLFFETAYQTHPYRYPVIGHLAVYDRLTREDVLCYYRTRYVPNNMVFVIAGDVDAAAVCGQLEQLFEHHPRKALPPVFIAPEPPQMGRRVAHHEFATELSRLMLTWHIPAIDHPDVPALDVLASVLGEGRSARLYRQLREERGLVYAVSSSAYTPGHPGLFIISSVMEPARREEAEAAILQLVGEVQGDGVTEAEIRKARKMMVADQFQHLVTARGRASDLGSSWLLAHHLDFSRQYIEGIQAVTADDVQRVARQYLCRQNETVVSLNPKGSQAAVVGDKADAREAVIQKFTLSNGLRLLVKEDPRLPLISAHAVFRGGLLLENAENAGISRLFARTLIKGTAHRSAGEIAATIESVGGAIASDAGNNSCSVSVEATRDDLRLALELWSEVMLQPSFPEGAIEREKESLRASQQAEQEQINSIARNLLRATLFPGHPYGLRAVGTADSVDAITRGDLLNYHRSVFTASNGVIAVFGDVQAQEVRDWCESLFAGLPVGRLLHENVPQPQFPSAHVSVEAREDRAQAVLMVGFPGVDMFHEDKTALSLIEEAGSDMGSRFFTAIRENLGLCYYVGSSQLVGMSPGAFTFYVGTDPARVGLVEEVLLGEIDRLAAGGLSMEELVRARKKLIGQQAIHHQSNDSLAYLSALDELFGLGHDHHAGLEDRVNAVDLPAIQRVAQKYFLNRPRVITVVRPPDAVSS